MRPRSAVLVVLFRHPRALSFVVAAFGLIYGLVIVAAFSAFALVFAPAALCLLVRRPAALVPLAAGGPAAPGGLRDGRLAATVLIPAVALVLLAL